MLLFLIAYAGGVLTILSPCILPVLPFVFARADRPFVRSGLPLLLGMALTFAGVATLAALGGGWAVEANRYGRATALALMALFGLTLLFPAWADRLMRPLVALGARLSEASETNASGGGIGASLLLGVATGLLWAPCAGPILGLVLTGAALSGASARTSLLLLAYAAGAATSLALALAVGGRVFALMKRSLGAGEWVRRGLGAALLCAVAVIALGLDTGFLARASIAGTSSIEQALVEHAGLAPRVQTTTVAAKPGTPLPDEGPLPALTGAVEWLNSPQLTAEQLRGKVVLVDFWTYSCINCLRTLPYVRAWAAKYPSLVVIGVHTPEFAFEKDVGNVRRAAHDLGITYPIAIDNNWAVWGAFNNRYWPAHYFVDAKGRIRHHHFGEGDDARSEQVIQQLLAEAGHDDVARGLVAVDAAGALAAADVSNVRSPETYLGYGRGERYASTGGMQRDQPTTYATASPLQLNQWALKGDWTIERQRAVLDQSGGRLVYRFHARDLHLVMGSTQEGRPVRFRVRIDGQSPQGAHGTDIDAQGAGTINGERLYQLVRQQGPIADREFEIEFLDPGAAVYAFTFG